jgi:hypothetical protein
MKQTLASQTNIKQKKNIWHAYLFWLRWQTLACKDTCTLKKKCFKIEQNQKLYQYLECINSFKVLIWHEDGTMLRKTSRHLFFLFAEIVETKDQTPLLQSLGAEKRKRSAGPRKSSTEFRFRIGKVHYSQNWFIHLIDLIYMHYQN